VRKEILIDIIYRHFLLYLPPRPLGTPPPRRRGIEILYLLYIGIII